MRCRLSSADPRTKIPAVADGVSVQLYHRGRARPLTTAVPVYDLRWILGQVANCFASLNSPP